MTEPRTQLEIRRAANIMRAVWREGEPAANEDEAAARMACGCVLSALMWASGDDGEHATNFGTMIDGARESLRNKAAQN